MSEIKWRTTDRGFVRGEFTDLYGSKCSIQESSLATDYAIWLGVHEPSPDYTESGSHRMHINQAMADELIQLLQYFVNTGFLPSTGER